MAHLNQETRERYCRVFVELDTDGNGWLSREEVGAWLRGAGYNLNDQQIERIFRIIDTNADGKITLDEFYSAMELIQKPAGDSDTSDIKTVFQAMDKNGDGQLSEDELYEGLNKCGYDLTREQVKTFVINMDKNGDGQIDFEEFLAAFKTK